MKKGIMGVVSLGLREKKKMQVVGKILFII